MAKTAKSEQTAPPAGSQPAGGGTREVPRWRVLDRVQLAEALGVHPDTISDYVRKGMPTITMGGHGKAAEYDLVACGEWWRSQQGKNAKDIAQTRALNSTAELNELKLKRERGELLAREDVVKDGQAYTKAWANSIRAIARRARQAGIVTTPQAESDLNALCRQLLTDISNWKTRADAEKAARKGVAA